MVGPPILRNKGVIAGLSIGNQWFIKPEKYGRLFRGGGRGRPLGGGWLTCHNKRKCSSQATP